MDALTTAQLGEIVERLRLAVFVFRDGRLVYANRAGSVLRERLGHEQGVELLVTLRHSFDEWASASAFGEGGQGVSLMTAPDGESFYIHLLVLPDSDPGSRVVVVSVRELGIEREAFRRRYRLSPREAQVAELVLRGLSNQDIARSLGMKTTTVKKHLSRTFDKVGVDSRAQLIGRLA
jgi:DNA-binding CsgD family transcriptional regulator